MSKEPRKSDRLLDDVDAQIEALKRQRERFERLIDLLSIQQSFLDWLSSLYFEIMRLRHELGREMLAVPPGERGRLEQALGREASEESIRFLSEALSRLIRERRTLTLAEMRATLTGIDALIEVLSSYVEEMRTKEIGKAEESTIRRVRDVTLKRVAPICFGLALIGVNIPSQCWPTVIGGSASIAYGLERR